MAERPLRIVLSEGSSTSAREAITALGLKGHAIDICDPDPRCLGRFSRFVRRFHRCPGLGVDPEGYLAFMLDLVKREPFDVLLPIHEQGFLVAKTKEKFAPHVAVALPSFASYDRAHGKASFSRLLAELGLPQPATRIVLSKEEFVVDRLPAVVKTTIGTASRGTWLITTAAGRDAVRRELDAANAFGDAVLVQDFVPGAVEHAQAVFAHGALVGLHGYRQIVRGAGGGEAVKESVRRPLVRAHMAAIGQTLRWHGALSVDYIVADDGGEPHYIDCNPRLVESMSAYFAGLDLVDLLVRVSLGETPAPGSDSSAGVRTHIALQALLAEALRGGSRRELLKECWRLATMRGIYVDSREELTPVRHDWPSAIPLTFAALWLLANPNAATTMAKKGWGAHLLTPKSAALIRSWGG